MVSPELDRAERGEMAYPPVRKGVLEELGGDISLRI
jgi:hypothetical protein